MRIALNTFVYSMLLSGAAYAQVPADPSSYSRTSAFEYDPVTGLLTSETVEPDNPQLCVKTTYLYDDYGNRKSATSANCDGATGKAVFVSRGHTSDYAGQSTQILTGPDGTPRSDVAVSSGAFPTLLTNALQQSNSVFYDPRFGAKVHMTGPNDLTTSWQVDDFGRTYKETRADAVSTLTLFCYIPGRIADTSSNYNCPSVNLDEVPADAVSFVWSEVHNGQDVKIAPGSRVYADRAGRKLRTVSEGYDGASQAGGAARLIFQDIEYNALGMQVLTTQPYFADTGASTATGAANSYGMSLTTYDALGRPQFVYTTDDSGSQTAVSFLGHGTHHAAVTGFVYDGLNTTTTDDQQHARVAEKNVDGKVWRTTDARGAQVVNQYDPFGNLVATKDALQNVANVKYNIRGHKVSLSDPDTGTWLYDHNALGELVWQQSPNQLATSVATTISYDKLGRTTQRVDPNEYTSTWFYDSYADGSNCSKGIGKLCESQTTSGVNKKVVYDAWGRVVNTRTDIADGPSFASAVAYDNVNGWVKSQTYPTGLTVNYQHTGFGFLSGLTLATAATVNPLPVTAGGSPGAGSTMPAGSLLWKAQSYSAWGNIEQQTYGNNVSAIASYEEPTGRVHRITAGLADATDMVDHTYFWNGLSQLVGRDDADGDGSTGAVTDSFVYDEVGRLHTYSVSATAIPGQGRETVIEYNALGSVLSNSDVGVYTYPLAGAGHPHALQNVAGAFTSDYGYDANGNMNSASAGSYRKITYNSFNLPDSQTGLQGAAGMPQYTWQYDENHQRIKEVRTNGSGTRTTWMLHPDDAGGLGFESEQSGGTINNRHYLSAGGTSLGVLISTDALPVLLAGQTAPAALANITLDKVEYWHKDHLGSLVATTDGNAAVTARYSYDPFGKRRTVSGNYDANGTLVYDWNNTRSGTDRGYTGHEHLDDVGVIHMNGRIFDPRLGMFMQGDPFVQNPANLQNLNRYGYCYNNPMTCADPSGKFFGIDDWIVYAIVAAWAAEKANVINVQTARLITSIAVSAGFGPPANIGEAAATGFVSGTIAQGNVEGGLQGAFSAGMFFGAGNVIQGGNFFTGGTGAEWGTASGIALHGVIGCVTSEVEGGKCGAGALSAAFSKAFAPATNELSNGDPLIGAGISAAIGGAGSVLGGGKFANGAATGAFSYLFNCWSHPGTCTPKDMKMISDRALSSLNSGDWAYSSNVNGPANVWKCSTFVGDVLDSITGLDAPEYSRFSWHQFKSVDTYWQAGMWADPSNDGNGAKTGWAITKHPVPGDVFSWRVPGEIDATGHTGIYLGNGNGIWAGKNTVNTGNISKTFGEQSKNIVYRTYVGD